jgi:tRNA (guanine-N7-)-methyltransferase
MSRKKRRRFAQLKEFSNVLDRNQVAHDDHWIQKHFGNDHPIVLELGCGRGEYTIALALDDPDRNILGIDKKGARLWKGARYALEMGIRNAAFLRISIEDLVEFIPAGKVEEIWIPFPDPLPKRRQAKHRLISRPFLDIYRAKLKKRGRIHLKTDDEDLVNYLLHLLESYPAAIHENSEDLYAAETLNPLLSVKTTYELRYLEAGRSIKYVCFGFDEGERQ